MHFMDCDRVDNSRTLIGRGLGLRTESSHFKLHPPTTHASFPSMASTMLRRQLCSRFPRIPQRSLSSTSAVRQLSQAQQAAQTTGAKNVSETHTVEDLQDMHASDILAETGSRKEAKIRHFTGASPRPGNLTTAQLLKRLPLCSQLWVRKICLVNESWLRRIATVPSIPPLTACYG